MTQLQKLVLFFICMEYETKNIKQASLIGIPIHKIHIFEEVPLCAVPSSPCSNISVDHDLIRRVGEDHSEELKLPTDLMHTPSPLVYSPRNSFRGSLDITSASALNGHVKLPFLEKKGEEPSGVSSPRENRTKDFQTPPQQDTEKEKKTTKQQGIKEVQEVMELEESGQLEPSEEEICQGQERKKEPNMMGGKTKNHENGVPSAVSSPRKKGPIE